MPMWKGKKRENKVRGKGKGNGRRGRRREIHEKRALGGERKGVRGSKGKGTEISILGKNETISERLGWGLSQL